MTYAVKADLIARYGEQQIVELTDRAGVNAIDDAVLNQALADADALIDGYLAARYALPLSPVPRSITLLACDLARYLLYGDAVPEAVLQRHKHAMRTLEAIAGGTVQIGPSSTGADPQGDGGAQMAPATKDFARSESW